MVFGSYWFSSYFHLVLFQRRDHSRQSLEPEDWRVSGEYSSVKKGGIDKATLILKGDSSFSYKVSTEMRGIVTFNGRWHLKKDTVILSVTDPFKDDSLLKKERVISKNSDRNRIRIFVQDTVPFTLAKVFINDSSSATSLDDSAQSFLKDKIKKVVVRYRGMKDRNFVISSILCEDVTVLICDKLFFPSIYLMPILKWLVYKEGLVPLQASNKPFKEVYIRVSH